MAKLQHPVVTSRNVLRPGEGTPLDIVATSEVDGLSIGVNLASAPVPDRHYVADACCVAHAGTLFKLIFVQQQVVGDELRSMLVVHMSVTGVRRLVDALLALQKPSLQEIADAGHMAAEPMLQIKKEPSQAVALAANMGIAGISGYEAVIDFFQASPFSLMAASQAKKLSLESVVRVEVRTPLLLGLVKVLGEMLAKVPKSRIDGE